MLNHRSYGFYPQNHSGGQRYSGVQPAATETQKKRKLQPVKRLRLETNKPAAETEPAKTDQTLLERDQN